MGEVSLVADPEQRARFEREARAASSLNHAHICVIHDVGSRDGTNDPAPCRRRREPARRNRRGPAIEVRWPSGRLERFETDEVDRIFTLTEGMGRPFVRASP